MADGVDLGPAVRLADERIVCRNGAVVVQAKCLAEDGVAGLPQQR
jgi:hypothetical protein